MKHFLLTVLTTVYTCAFIFMASGKLVQLQKSTSDITSPINNTFSVFALENKSTTTRPTVYGFLPYWKLEKIEHIQLDKLTDIAYFALRINSDGKIRRIEANGETEPGYNNWKNNKQLDALIAKSKKENVNFALTIISHEDDVSDTFLDCTKCWDTLISEIKTELKNKNIKDINLDFEYVEYPTSERTELYTAFIKKLNIDLDMEFGNSIVTVSTFADSNLKPRITDPEQLAKAADKLFIMAYDFHYPNSTRAGPVAPINKVEGYTSYDINTMLKDYLKNIAPNKLILGVPYYGYNWVVDTPDAYASRRDGNDYIGYSTPQTYEDLVDTIIEIKPNVSWDETAQVPYFAYTSPNTGAYRVVYFENQESLRQKYRLAKSYSLAGVGIWALGYDGGYQELWSLLATEFAL